MAAYSFSPNRSMSLQHFLSLIFTDLCFTCTQAQNFVRILRTVNRPLHWNFRFATKWPSLLQMKIPTMTTREGKTHKLKPIWWATSGWMSQKNAGTWALWQSTVQAYIPELFRMIRLLLLDFFSVLIPENAAFCCCRHEWCGCVNVCVGCRRKYSMVLVACRFFLHMAATDDEWKMQRAGSHTRNSMRASRWFESASQPFCRTNTVIGTAFVFCDDCTSGRFGSFLERPACNMYFIHVCYMHS